MIRLCALALMFWPVGVFAQTEAAEQARRAMADLEAASAQLDAADGARDRVQALTQTIQAFETGLGAMREGLRQAAINEAQKATGPRWRGRAVAGRVAKHRRQPVAHLVPAS